MDRIEFLFEKWAGLEVEAQMAILAYDEGEREESMAQFACIWRVFQETFAAEEDRTDIGQAYQETMNMLLNRMYLDLEETGSEEDLWEFCRQVCRLFRPDEIWLEDYAGCIGRLMQKERQYEACDRWFEACQRAEPENPVYIAQWAACLAERGEVKRALAMLDEGVKRAPECSYGTLGFYRLARGLYQQLQRDEQAEICRQKICELDEDLLTLDEEE